MKRILLIASLAAIGLAGCEAPAVGRASTNNGNLEVEHLVTIEQCRVYRFKDDGHNRYVTICPQGERTVTEGSHTVSCGKGCTRQEPEMIETVYT